MADGDGGRDLTPTVPESHLSGWTETERTSETVFELSAASIVGHTVVYEDSDLRAAVRDATGGALDRTWRFFFATRLTFSPPLPPMVGPAAVFSTVVSEATDAFADRLRDRGFEAVATAESERVRVDSGDRARLRRYSAVLDTPLPDGGRTELPVEGWLGVWTTDGEFRLAGGAYPGCPLTDALGVSLAAVETEPTTFRADLLDLVRAVR